jgi:hypothetical protein
MFAIRAYHNAFFDVDLSVHDQRRSMRRGNSLGLQIKHGAGSSGTHRLASPAAPMVASYRPTDDISQPA